MNTIEKIARAICRAHRVGFGNMSKADKQETEDKAWDKHIPDAHAALLAIRETVTEEMTTAGVGVIDSIYDKGVHNIPHTLSANIFQAMIDTALKTEEKTPDPS